LWAIVILVLFLIAARGLMRDRRAQLEKNTSEEVVKMLMSFDKNGDGKLDPSELPERLQSLFDRGDTNHDGILTQDEIQKLADVQTHYGERKEARR
jgi:Ca2+-binding EF-hand superfamily protein